MARTSTGPRYYESKGGWFANIRGARIPLAYGPKEATRKSAQEKYKAEAAASDVEVEGDRNTVWAIVNAYVADLENRVSNLDASPGLLDMQRPILVQFSQACGLRKVRDLRPQHLDEW